MDFYDALRVQALHDVLTHGPEYSLRHIFRWYSKVFHTPLHLVSSVPTEDILVAYFEEHFEDLLEGEDGDERIEAQRKLVIETEEQRKVRIRDQESGSTDDDNLIKQLADENSKKLEDVQIAPQEPRPIPMAIATEARLAPTVPKLPENVSIKFADDAEFQRLVAEED